MVTTSAGDVPGRTDTYWSSSSRDSDLLRTFAERKETVAVVIPALNEAQGLSELIDACRPFADRIVVVDGGSTDDTVAIAESCGVDVLHDNRLGKGDALRVAIDRVDEDILVFIDADFSHNPAHIPRLVVPLLTGKADMAIGSRGRGGSDELHGDLDKFIRRLGSDIITLGINYRFNADLTDVQNGFRAIRGRIARTLGLRENITTIEQEMTMRFLRKGHRIAEVPCHEYARRWGQSRVTVWRVAPRFVWCWLRHLLLP